MQLIKPDGVLTQVFGGNANPYYSGHGLKGHPGMDFQKSFDYPRQILADGVVYKILSKNNPDPSIYRAVCTLVDNGNIVYEVIYGHCNQIYCDVGNILPSLETYGTEGNTGEVYSGGVPVTKEARLAGSHAGEHLHLQVRPCKRVQTPITGMHYLLENEGIPGNSNLYRDSLGYYYEVIFNDNGYNGCVDPSQFFINPTPSQRLSLYIKVVLQLAKQIFKL